MSDMPKINIFSKTRGIDPYVTDVEVDLTAWQDLQKKVKNRKPGNPPPSYVMKPWPNLRGELVIRAKCDRCGTKAWLSVLEADRMLKYGSEVICRACFDEARDGKI